MPSTSTVLAGDIAAPMDRVFALLVDPRKIPDWLPGCYGVGGAPLVYKGARLLVRFGMRTSAFEITDFVPPTTFGWAELGARAGSKTFFQLGFAGGTTAIKMKHISTFLCTNIRSHGTLTSSKYISASFSSNREDSGLS